MLPVSFQGDDFSSTTASTPRTMENVPAILELPPEQAAAAILNAINMEQDRQDWECELRLNMPRRQQYRHIWGVAYGSRQFWPDQCLRLDAFWSSLGTSIGITPAHDGFRH